MAKIEECSWRKTAWATLEEARELCLSKGVDVDAIVKGVQPIAFENAVWAYTLGVALAHEAGRHRRRRSFRRYRRGPAGFLRARFGGRAAQGRPGPRQSGQNAAVARKPTASPSWPATNPSPPQKAPSASPARPTRFAKSPLRVILNGLGKDAAYIISRINGFTYVETDYDFYTGELKIVKEKRVLRRRARQGQVLRRQRRARGRGHHAAREAWTFPSPATPPTPPVSSTWWPAPIKSGLLRTAKSTSPWLPAAAPAVPCIPDNMAAGPASYGLTDSMGRMHGDAQFAGSSSVPAHVEMMGLIGMGNNPMVGATVACAVAVCEALQ